MWIPDICIYHGNCADGFGAAWAIWKRWHANVEYVPGIYGKPLPDVAGKHVLFVDFSAKRAEIDAMAQAAKSIVIIDHHKTAEADLEPFKVTLCGGASFAPDDLDGMFRDMAELGRPPVLAWFDMKQSGATMAWKFAHGLSVQPYMLQLIEDRDLWRFAFGERTMQFSAALRTYQQDFGVWSDISVADPSRLYREGASILRAHRTNIAKFIAEVYWTGIAGHTVPVVNVPYHYASDLANELLAVFPDAPFAACWFQRGDGRLQYSLRSEDSRLDVSEIAKKFGGGGHRNSAGFQLPAQLHDVLPHPAQKQ